MNQQLSLPEAQVMWVIGAYERLATLGLFDSNVPLKISSDSIDTFLLIDKYRNAIFCDDSQVAEIFKIIAQSESEEEINDKDMNNMIELILNYKNQRERLVKYALSRQFT